MKNIVIALVLFLSLAGQAQAQQTHVIGRIEGLGGSPYEFIARANMFRQNDVRVVVTGNCVSSCTLYTSLLPDGLICAMPGAKLVFHRYNYLSDVQVDGKGRLKSYKIAETLAGPEFMGIWRQYPLSVRKRIMQESPEGLPAWGNELSIRATELVPAC